MLMLFFNLILSILFIFLLPWMLIRFRREERKMRFGNSIPQLKNCIWIHAASVGEVNAVKSLIIALLNKHVNKTFILSTMTNTGLESARQIHPKLITTLFPLDINFIMKKAFRMLNPELVILVETEFWPNMLSIAKRKNIPVLIVNGRISERTYPKYKRLSFFWKPLWKAIKTVSAQSDHDANRFKSLGFNNVIINQNLKFCLQLSEFKREKIRNKWNITKNDFIIVFGSSRPGEEKLINKIFPILKKEISNLKLIVVPRHLERILEVEGIFKELNYQLYTELKSQTEIIIVDKMGILTEAYAISDLAIVGGSFFDFGGHNPLEPAFYGLPIIMGEFYSSCIDSVNKLKQNEAIIISSKNELQNNILKITQNPDYRSNLGINAKKTLQQNSDSLKKNLEIIERYIK
ncbi:MAG: 3-deoxy-D-manno-octulosonic acid transferase [Armatimonadetes bacterium]|nr:3-deoxy-D-manno-octulosonic acid transferase [Armatimonadota bacterium]